MEKMSPLGLSGPITDTADTLLLISLSIITFSGSGALNFADSSDQSWAAGQQLSVYYRAPTDTLSFGSGTTALTLSQLQQIHFYSDNGTTPPGTAAFSGVGEDLIAVPEPGAMMFGLGVALLVLFRLPQSSRRKNAL